ncbi:MAG: TIGR04283 family arsenosugar biosynthesis glycosyltransferase [Hyphomonadaceae bacterium]
MSVSIIIPALNAGGSIGATLASAAGVDEIIVIDGGSSDATVAAAEAAGARVIVTARGRGRQLAAGAVAARSDWLLFLHADTVLAPEWLGVAHEHMASGRGTAAAFRFALDDSSWQARLLERGVDLRTRWLGLPYGDQGLLIDRELYDELGGYRPIPIMEDVDLVRRIGAKRLIQLECAAITSATRWRRRGWVRQSLGNQICLALYFLGVSPEHIRRLYEH